MFSYNVDVVSQCCSWQCRSVDAAVKLCKHGVTSEQAAAAVLEFLAGLCTCA
jgi:hypothetical protein